MLTGFNGWVGRLAWHPTENVLAAGSEDGFVSIWNLDDKQLAPVTRLTKRGLVESKPIPAVSWLRSGATLAAAGETRLIAWDLATRQRSEGITWELSAKAYCLDCSIDGSLVVVGTESGHLVLHDLKTSKTRVWPIPPPEMVILAVAFSPDGSPLVAVGTTAGLWLFDWVGGHASSLTQAPQDCPALAWSPDGRTLVSAGHPGPLHVWDPFAQREVHELQGHTARVTSLAFSPDGSLLASRANDGSWRLWRTDGFDVIHQGSIERTTFWPPGLAFHPRGHAIAVANSRSIEVWKIDDLLRSPAKKARATHYTNAKIVLVGNASVGKSGLGLVLAGHKFRATESTHGRRVWVLEDGERQRRSEEPIREKLLWDLAGQPGYRLIHQLHLGEVAVALVLFDAKSEIDPFEGVSYWAQALDEATGTFPLVKFLVASRTDRGGPKVSDARIQEVVTRYGFDGYFETSAKTGVGIEELRVAINEAIKWDALPKVSTPQAFYDAKQFLVEVKRSGTVVASRKDLHLRFEKRVAGVSPELFETCLGRLESAGLVRRLDFGGLVLLQPEFIDDYCGWMAFAAREQPDGLGFIEEDKVHNGQFRMEEDRRVPDDVMERTLLLATAAEAVSRNIAFRQETEKGVMLVFPSELNAELPDFPGGYSLAVAFTFGGPVAAIYATLAVTLLNSTAFRPKHLYKNAALFTGPKDRVCGFAMEYPDREDDAFGRLVVFFDDGISADARLMFLRYVNAQLGKLALQDTVVRERIYQCQPCNLVIPPEIVARRRAAGYPTVICPVCVRSMPFDDLAEKSGAADTESMRLQVEAREEGERQARRSLLPEKQRLEEFHAFISYHSIDQRLAVELKEVLADQGLNIWIDDDQLKAGDRFLGKLQEVLEKVEAVIIASGSTGFGPFQWLEVESAMIRAVEQKRGSTFRVIPILLPGTPEDFDLPLLLKPFGRVDLRQGIKSPEGIKRLVDALLQQGGASLAL